MLVTRIEDAGYSTERYHLNKTYKNITITNVKRGNIESIHETNTYKSKWKVQSYYRSVAAD